MRNGRYGLSILVDGVAIPETIHSGKCYIAAPYGKDFELKVRTPGARHEVVLSVDGLSVMTGQDAGTDERGYCVNGGELTIPGFRLNDYSVAKFHFGDRRDAYASKLGKPKNVGVIAAVVYAEKVARPIRVSAPIGGQNVNGPSYTTWYDGLYEEASLSSFNRGTSPVVGLNYNTTLDDSIQPRSLTGRPAHKKGGVLRAAGMGGVGHDMGTEFGQQTEHNVSYVTFDRGVEVARFVIEYASYDSLIASGIIPANCSVGQDLNPFPANTGCKPPAGWRGF